MFFSFFFNIISPHQMPLAKRLAALLGADHLRYIYQKRDDFREQMGWEQPDVPTWCEQGASEKFLQQVDVLFSGERNTSLFLERSRQHRMTIYASERWFKPPLGFFRMLFPKFFRLAYTFYRLLKGEDFFYFPTGAYAARDMARICNLFERKISSFGQAPKIAFESRPGGIIIPLQQAIDEKLLDAHSIAFAERYGFVHIPEAYWGKSKPQGFWKNMRMWGYFVEPSAQAPLVSSSADNGESPIKILWVGRVLDWKKVDTLLSALRTLPAEKYTLDIYGKGDDEIRIKSLARGLSNVTFHDFVPIEQVRKLMQAHDVYVLPSSQREGWGAVLNEALEEKMAVLSSIGTGAGTVLLPIQSLFDVGDAETLSKKLRERLPRLGIGKWGVDNAVSWLAHFILHNCPSHNVTHFSQE